MLERTSDDDGHIVATFVIPDADGAERACVVGEFNQRSPTAHPMKREGNTFVARIALDPGRTYRFRYLLDGHHWANDWAADAYVPNEFGGNDSLLDLTDSAAAPLVANRCS